jgi:hypothetical protein
MSQDYGTWLDLRALVIFGGWEREQPEPGFKAFKDM